MFEKVLIANRGEIAFRVMRACRDMGIGTVAIYGDEEQNAPHARYADEAYRLESESPIPYLDIDAILAVAKTSGAGAVHPGYGFLAENAEFARRSAEAGVTFIGPGPDAISSMGDKIRAREIARSAGVPLVPGSADAVQPEDASRLAGDIGFPVALKAAAGGGGRGFRVARDESELAGALDGASGEAERYFADPRVFVERYLDQPRHVEIQVLADAFGTTVALGERDCSVQRRHQKLIEESPSPVLTPGMRAEMESAAVRLAEHVGYLGAGTVEFLVQGEEFFFLEMNTRIQVEHPVTEMITGVDLVCQQIRIAAGKAIDPEDLSSRFGHAIEFRINAEDVAGGFQPVSGVVTASRVPEGPGVRFDGVLEPGSEVNPRYDSLLGKLVIWGRDRPEALARGKRALDELAISGLATTVAFHRAVLDHPAFQSGNYDTRFLERYPEVLEAMSDGPVTPIPANPGSSSEHELIQVEVNGRRFDVRVYRPMNQSERRPPRLSESRSALSVAPEGSETIISPIQGTVLSVAVETGDSVRAGQVVCVVEAMKMENEISAGRDGIVSRLNIKVGETVESGAVVAVIESGEGDD